MIKNAYLHRLGIFLRAERIKQKRGGIYTISLLLGALIPVGIFIGSFFSKEVSEEKGLGFNIYEHWFEGGSVEVFTGFFLFIIIFQNASRVAQVEHQSGGWQLMELLPLPKTTVFFGKYGILLSANALAIVSFLAFGCLTAWATSLFSEVPPEATTFFPLGFLLGAGVNLWIAALLLTALQYTLSVLVRGPFWKNILWIVGLGIAPVLSKVFHPFGGDPFFILKHTGENLRGGDFENLFLYTEVLGLLLSGVVLWGGFLKFSKKTFYRAFWMRPTQKITTLVGGAVVILGVHYYLLPKTLAPYPETVICGTIESDYTIQNVFLLDPVVQDTLAIIPVRDQQFHQRLDISLPLNAYIVQFDAYFDGMVHFSNQDSIHIKARLQNGKTQLAFGGTRIAENVYPLTHRPLPLIIEEKPSIEALQNSQATMLHQLEKEVASPPFFVTRDNITYRPDFGKRLIKERILAYLLWKEKLSKTAKALHSQTPMVWDKGWKTYEQYVSLQDIELLQNTDYRDYLKQKLLEKDTSAPDNSTKILHALSLLPAGNFRDKLYFITLREALENSNGKAEREAYASYFPQLQNQRYKTLLQSDYEILKKMGRGVPAMDIETVDINNTPHRLSELKGKWVIIDFWATWCVPCLMESPFFEDMAVKYKKENVSFVSISLDQNYNKWLVEAKNKSSDVVQWYAKGLSRVNQGYHVQTIPRFVMIDPQGNFYQAKMPRPSERSAIFETLLRKALGLGDLE